MLKHTLLALALGAMAATASAQNCASLTVTGTGAPGTSLTFALDSGVNNAFALLAVGDTQGTTTLTFGSLATLTLGLAEPFLAVPLGRTDGSGDVSLTVNVPNQVSSMNLFGQGVVVSFAFQPTVSLSFCTSNVAPFHVGT